MNLSAKDADLFYKLTAALLLYVNSRLKICENNTISIKNFQDWPMKEKVEMRRALYENIQLIDSFVKGNPFDLSSEELEIVKSWKHFVSGSFYIIRFLTNYTVFLDTDNPPLAYGVVGIIDPIDKMFLDPPPIMANACLLPFKGKIIHDGLIGTKNIHFGAGIRKNLNHSYQESKARFGIITSLPFSPSSQRTAEEGAEMLKFYLKSEQNREYYWDEIEELAFKSSGLMNLYHQEMGKIHARRFKKKLREMGFKNTWFAVLQGLIIASAPSKNNLLENLDNVLPAGKAPHVYTFHLKK